MCSEENGAPHAVRYLNAQLIVLHENARRCLEEHPQARREDNQQFYALAEFAIQRPGVVSYAPSKSESLFYACFTPPKLQFICDHDALLTFTVQEGHIVIDGQKANRLDVVELQPGLSVSYRVGFETRKIIGNDTKIGDRNSVIELMILDLKHATISSIEPEQTFGRNTLLRYLNQYINLLHDAGNHVLFSLPHFGRAENEMVISYSLMESALEIDWLDSVYGVSVQQIDAYMSSLWLKSAMLAYGSISGDATEADLNERCFAEVSCHENGNFFRIKFGAPHVKVLCSKEVVLQFDIDEVEFWEHDDFSAEPVRKYTKWKISVVVNVLQGRGVDEHVVRIVYDLTNARYHDGLSVYAGIDEEDEEYRETIIAFFVEEYLEILHGAGYHILYEHDARWESIKKLKFESVEDADGSWWSLDSGDSNGVSSRETIQRAKMYGFDQVVAISQGSINTQFTAQWANASATLFHSWAYEQCFSTVFKAPSIQLLSNDRAIIWVSLASGSLKALRDWAPCSEGDPYEFRDWRIAFEVNLKMCTQSEFEGGASATFVRSLAYERHGKHDNRELNHIYMDLRHAEYLHEYSTYPDIRTDGEDSRAIILKLQAVIYYLTQHYFLQLCAEGMSVISSVPVWKTGNSLPSYALTSVAFHVYTRVEVARHNWAHVPAGMEPIVVVLGMTGFRPLPAAQLEFSTCWIVQANRGFSHGTLSIARRVFIEERLLALLSNVNALTTLIPLMVDPLLGFHGVRLKKWAEHEQRKDRPSKWQLQQSEEGCLKYIWEHCEEWRYKTEGSGDMMNATHGISCITRNYVELPTAVKQGAMHIKVGGKVELSLALQTTGKTAKSYNASSSVSWSTNVTVHTVGSSVKVNTFGSHDPVFAKASFTDGGAGKFRSPMDMLRDAFPDKVGLEELVNEIHAFEGAWDYCYPPAVPYSLASPVFNDDGDLLFELRRYGATAVRSTVTSPAGRLGRSASPVSGRRSNSRIRVGRLSPAPHSPTRSPICKLFLDRVI
ncbi:hypothetical protein C2E23DRAFT_726184 [Lenzites betulinus]|nr:hypothetical protein C2E23DRAFT_726184 [Lenzites betulinus]